MESPEPEYKLDFEVVIYFRMKDDFEAKTWDGSRIVFCRSEESEETNKGFIIYKTNTLDHGAAKEEGMKRVDAFLNSLMIAANVENIKPTIFAESPTLLNSDEFEGTLKTHTKEITGNITLVADFQKQWAESASSLSSGIHELPNNKQAAIDRCLFWLRKGAETTSNERFFYRWVSLEALTGFLETLGSTESLVNSLINKLRNESAETIFHRNKELVKQLEVAQLISWKERNRSEELKEAIDALGKNGDYKAVIVKTVSCIYEVRNKFIHRGEATSLINGCNTLLRELIHALLTDLLQNTHD